jgi:O-antigen/teichoic acid export membrane protein
MTQAPVAGAPVPPAPRRRTFLFEFARLASANFFAAFIQVCIGIATIRIWGVDARGRIEVVMALPSLMSILFDLGLGRALPYTIGRKLAPMQTIVSTTLIMWIVASALGAGICLAYASSQPWDDIPKVWIALAIAYLPLRLFAGVILGFCVGVERISTFTKLIWIREPIALALLIGLAAFPGLRAPEDAWVRIATINIAFLLTAALGIRVIAAHSRFTLAVDRRVLGEMTHRSMTFGLGPLFLELLQYTPSMLLTISVFAVPPGDIGNYTVGAAIALLLMQVAYALGHVLMSRSVNSEDHDAITGKTLRLLRVGVVGATVMGLGIMATAPVVVPLVYGPGTFKAPWITVLMVPGVVGFFGLHTLATDLISKGHAMVVARVGGVALAANIGICALYAIPAHGIWGAAASTAAIYIIAAGAMLVVYTRVTRVTIREAITIRSDDLPVAQIVAGLRRRIGR